MVWPAERRMREILITAPRLGSFRAVYGGLMPALPARQRVSAVPLVTDPLSGSPSVQRPVQDGIPILRPSPGHSKPVHLPGSKGPESRQRAQDTPREKSPAVPGAGGVEDRSVAAAGQPDSPSPAAPRNDLSGERVRRLQALGEMAAVLAHEIRNPLGSMELFAELIKDACRDRADVSQWAVHLLAGLRALAATVNNVLRFYTQAPVERLRVDAAQLLAGTVEFLQPLALQRSVGVIFEPPDGEVAILADPYALQQVFFNLAINAFRAMQPGHSLVIRLKPPRLGTADSVQIEFEDSGPGIPPERLAQIFEAGFTTRQGSPGLGLTVSKRIVEQHDGVLQVESVLGKGTKFTLCLPAAYSS
jgi:signal transduction histidine kinase